MKNSQRPSRRRLFSKIRDLAKRGNRPRHGTRRNLPFQIESLEDRMMLASDLGLATDLPDQPLLSNAVAYADTAGAEGESVAVDDLVAFAKALDAAGAKLYGTAWCTTCTAQKELFEDGGQFLPFVEVTNPDRTLNQIGIDEDIEFFPTWVFPDDSREEGFLSLATISQRSGVDIPTSADPSFAPIGDLEVLGGAPYHLALNGYDPNGGPLTYTVTSSNPSLLTPTVLSGNRSARVSVQAYGDMVFELFESRAPDATGRFIDLAESGFYDAANNDTPITFHRVIDDFVIQFGDPTGTGAGGSTLGDFDDDFHTELQHVVPGGISWAKAGDDTNDSQLFILDVPTRFLDFNHSYFGQLVEGDAVRNAINSTATNSSDRPTHDVNIDSVEIFQDTENAIVMLAAPEGASGTADITVTVEDGDGNTYQEIFEVTVAPDPWNGGPFLNDIPDYETTVNTPINMQISAQDVEGDAVLYDGVKMGDVEYSFTVDASTGDVSITPPTNFVGTLELLVRVRPETSSHTSDTYDSQVLTLAVKPDSPTEVDLLASSDTGTLDNDNVTNASNLIFQIPGVTDGAVVQLKYGSTLLGQSTADGTTATIPILGLTTAGDGVYDIVATQSVNGIESDATDVLQVTIDTTSPGEFTTTPPDYLAVGENLAYDADNPDEGTQGFQYLLVNAPSGATIDTATGEVSWAPSLSQVGPYSFEVVAKDLAGNTRSQEINIDVGSEALIGFWLEITDLDGNQISVADAGDEFLLSVFVQDLRPEPSGVFGAFLDVIYSDQFVSIDGSLTFGPSYPNLPSGDLSAAGLIDEAGAISSFSALDGSEYLLFSIQMQANASGTASFVADPADDEQASELLMFDLDGKIDSADVIYGQATLVVDPAFDVADDTFTIPEDDSGQSIDVLANDEVAAGSPGVLTVTEAGISGQSGVTENGGTVEIIGGGTKVHYVPGADFTGTDTFQYTVSDGTGSKTAEVTVQVTPVNDDPTAEDDDFTVAEDAVEISLDALDNDHFDPDTGEVLKILSADQGSEGGVVTVSADGFSLLYTPAADFFGTEWFDYTIGDGNGGTAVGEVSVTVTEANDPPVGTADTVVYDEDSAGNIIDVLANDNTAGDTGETLSIVDVSVPNKNGTAVISDDDLTIMYTPAADFFGVEQFTYTVSDGNGGTAIVPVTISVEGSNDPPEAVDDNVEVIKDTVENILDVLANDHSGPDADELLTIHSVGTSTAGGQVEASADNLGIKYTPPAGFTGTDTLTYTIQDPDGATSEATVTVEVLDYVPSDLAGFVFFDVDNDGTKDNRETPIGGVKIMLHGTDQMGNTVELEDTTDAHGAYEFVDLAPGNYSIIEAHPQGVVDGLDSVGSHGGTVGNDELTVTLAQDVQAENYNFGEHGRAAKKISLFDFFASTPRESVITTAAADGESSWYAIEGGWGHAASMQVDVTDDPSKFALNVVDDQDQHFAAMLDLGDPVQVHQYSTGDNSFLMRIVSTAADLFPGAGCACDASGAEGEPVSSADSSGQAEGEPASVGTSSLIVSTLQSDAELTGWVADEAEGEFAGNDDGLMDNETDLSTPDPHASTDAVFVAVGEPDEPSAFENDWDALVDRDRNDYPSIVDLVIAQLL